VLEIRIDRRDGEKVTIDDCATVSRALEARLEADALVAEQYVLEVSSPGADRPLRHAADWRRFIGRQATVTCGLLVGGKQEVEILAVDGEAGAEIALVRVAKGREVQVPLREVTQASLAFHWKR
jgi:ribosome maturation factor RimP